MAKEAADPATLADLLRTLERDHDLRSLARECGLSVRELRRRLGVWRRELATPQEAATAAAGGGEPRPARRRKPAAWPELTDAQSVATSPLPATGSKILEVYTDGASKGNPGPAAVGAVFRQKDGPVLCGLSRAIGRATNNVAEYRAVIAALECVERWRVERVHLYVDSELIARQLTGAYRVKSPDLRPLYQQVVHLARRLRTFQVKHVKREHNAHADHLANLALTAPDGSR
jgi:ribonuclease HI